MASFRRLWFAVPLSLSAAAFAAAQVMSSIPVVPVSVVSRARDALTDTATEVAFTVRGLSQLYPTERLLEEAYVAIGPPGTDVRSHPARTAGTRADGTAKFSHVGGDSLTVVVLRIGYAAVRFSIGLSERCNHTIEVYVTQQAIIDGEVGGPPPPRPRVVLTTCAPPA
jgi:hypothetical protein